MDILDKFIEQARKNVDGGYYKLPTRKGVVGRGRISLREKLVKGKFALIAEIKHAAPSGEYSFSGIDVEQTAILFKSAGADAISVVVEPVIFKGSLGDIPLAVKVGLPVIFKDFVISKEQIKAASDLGADCILIIVKVANRLGLGLDEFIRTAHSLGLEVLLECYDEAEMRMAMATDADILGINNRDLQTLQVNLNRTRDILRMFSRVGGINTPVISESGIRSRRDAEFVKSAGASGMLVGTTLWLASDKRAKIAELKLG